MSARQVQLETYRQVAGAVQLPLVLVLWGALVLFFGHQYQANALLPQSLPGSGSSPAGALTATEVFLQNKRHARLLAEIALQAPARVPTLLSPEDFATDLARALAASDVTQGHWAPGKRTPVQRAANVVAPPLAAAPVAELHRSASRRSAAPSFVRLPASPLAEDSLMVDPLRAIKDRARNELLSNRSKAAYQLLRGQVTTGRTDIEFLGLLALASIRQQPAEARVIYQHLTQLQPDKKRWRQGLTQAQAMLGETPDGLVTHEPAPSSQSSVALAAGSHR